jgi:hypothetical protein
MQGWAQKMRRLTVDPSVWSTTSIVDGDGRSFADSGEHLRKGIAKIRRFKRNESDCFGVDAYGIKAELQGYFSWLGAACSSGAQDHQS